MTAEDLQTNCAARIAAVASLAAFGAAIVYDPAVAKETAKAAIDTRLRTTGVVIEIGKPEGVGGEGTQGRYSVVRCEFEVFVAENPQVTHSPSGEALYAAVRAAIQARTSIKEIAPMIQAWSDAESEQGYVMQIQTYSVPVLA